MSDHTEIAWTDATWNPVRGCTKVSAGCKNCYAERFAERFRGVPGHPFEQGFDVRLVPEALDLPLRWRKPRRIFVNSMSDLFHEAVPEEFIDRVFAVMALARQHVFQVLTKRADRMRVYLSTPRRDAAIWWAARPMSESRGRYAYEALPVPFPGQGEKGIGIATWPLPNVWLGVSVEDQRAADERIPHLLATPAAVRFISAEPLLGPVDLMPGLYRQRAGDPWLDWVIAGGESGPGARPCDLDWVRSILRRCRTAGVPAFCKQLGAHVVDRNDAGFDGEGKPGAWPTGPEPEFAEGEPRYQGEPVRVRLRDRKGGDPQEWPEDLRIRQFPTPQETP